MLSEKNCSFACRKIIPKLEELFFEIVHEKISNSRKICGQVSRRLVNEIYQKLGVDTTQDNINQYEND